MAIQLTPLQEYFVYEALVHALQTNSGIGFHNSDQGHPAYVVGRDGHSDYHTWGDSPEENEVYQLMVKLTNALGESARPPVRNWADFCQLATEGYRESKATA